MPPLPTFDGEDTTPEPGKGPLHRRTLSERDGDSSSFSSPLPPCPEDPPAPQSASCTPPKYQPQEENEEDTAKSEEDASSTQEVRSVEADDDDLSADADTEDMSIDIREERESALPTPPPPPSPPAATPMGGGTPPPPPPPPYSPPDRKPIPAAGNDASLKSTVADAQSRTGTVPSTMSSIASMRTAASNREIMATDVVRDPSPERPRWYIGEIENYTIIDKVGSGTYGEVFKCQHKITKDIVALKKMRSDVEKNGFPVTSIREMKILKQLKHPNVVTLKEIVSSNAPTKDGKRPPLYFAFEYLEHDLSGLLNHPRVKFSRTQIQCYMRQLLCGVAFMHRNKIVHRDIKASNLLLNNQGVLKVADFGLSRSWTEVNAKAGRYTNKVVTLWYRSPELLLGSTSYDFSVDVWSIGCIFGELLLGRPILQGKTEIDQLQMIFGLVGRPTEENWPEFKKLPGAKDVMFDDKYVCPLRERFKRTSFHVEYESPDTTDTMKTKVVIFAPNPQRGQKDVVVKNEVTNEKGAISFTSSENGDHWVCVSLDTGEFAFPKGSKMRFSLKIAMGPSSQEYADLANKRHTNDLYTVILKIRDRVRAVQRNQDYAKEKSLLYQSRIESNNKKAMWVSVAQIGLLIVTGFYQAQHLRKYFHKKKLV
ncbi:hypothetical protein Poli38472_003843 [Pythium oligandrum]|uniref:Cyclin-dependent kinase 2 homolog n=1 Tax=Pythium oligandrum TaxID=41045 RepID=A0A8K1CND2_PYTOL|nr:hypothetical protein Poli38472_003843 [Pythium oligandrum]|eukprot:TMW66078.1 hypothetical protein Poli38472_003843 [Pythium oligandrum]